MSWLLRNLVGNEQADEDVSDNDFEEETQRRRDVGVSDDLSQLTQSFTRQLKGFSSFLTGDDIVKKDLTEETRIGDPEKEVQKVGSDAEDRILEHVDKQSEAASELSEGAQDTGLEHESAVRIVQVAPGSADEAVDVELKQEELMKGIKNDFAEISGTLRSQFSKLSQVVRVVRGDDLVKADEEKGSNRDGAPGQYEVARHIHDDDGERSERKLVFPFLSPFSAISGSSKEASKVTSTERGDEHERFDDLSDEGDDDILDAAKEDIGALRDTIASKINDISKFASNFLPFPKAGLSDEEIEQAVAINDVTVSFVEKITSKFSSWVDFPLPHNDDEPEFTLSDAQIVHVEAMQYAVPKLVKVRLELTPEAMSESRFWKIYFVMILAKLEQAEAAILITEPVLEARNLVISILQQRKCRKSVSEAVAESPAKQEASSPLPVSVPLSAQSPEVAFVKPEASEHVPGGHEEDLGDADVDDWLDDVEEENLPEGSGAKVEGNLEETSFSDLEPDDADDEAEDSQQVSGSDSPTDWQKIEKDDV